MPRRKRPDAAAKLAQADAIGRALPENYADRDVHADFKAVFNTDQGKRVLARILAECHFWVSTDRGEDTHSTAWCNGKRDLGIWLTEIIAIEPPPQPAQTENE